MATKETVTRMIAGHEVTISSPDKIFFTKIEATKIDLIDFYQSIEGPLMAAMKDRPALLERYPDGASGKSFFQKRVPKGAPSWLETTVVSTPNGTTSNAMVAADIAHIAWAAQMGCLGFHLWPYKAKMADDPEQYRADQLRIDLDPSKGTDFDDIRFAARAVKELLDEKGVPCYPKTTGSRGLHLFATLKPQWDSYQVRAAAVALARELERRYPQRLTAAWWKEERGQRVFIDFNQNAPHKTVFGAWSVRPRVGGQVSTPFAWEELDTVNPETLTMDVVAARVAADGDPWAPMYEAPCSLEPLLAMHEADMEAGMMDAPWPPVYPKMPNEPPRVAPSRARKDQPQ